MAKILGVWGQWGTSTWSIKIQKIHSKNSKYQTPVENITLPPALTHGVRAMKATLIIFSRFPEVGRTKTRLIPALGPQGAADLQTQMTESIVHTAQRACERWGARLEICFWGGDRTMMAQWLGSEFHYQHQGPGNLGEKMARAFQRSFDQGSDRTVIIGSDCPSLTPEDMGQAFRTLERKDLVLGPATDGGYYLIALRRSHPELFQNIAWGTDQVFAQTLAIALHWGLSVGYLPPRNDIDRPEDLWCAWPRSQESVTPRSVKLR